MKSKNGSADSIGLSAKLLAHRFAQAIQAEPHLSRNLSHYAAMVLKSPKYLNAVCHKVFGKNPSTMINEAIAEAAKAHLSDPSATPKEVAENLGFSHAPHLHRFFKKTRACVSENLENRP